MNPTSSRQCLEDEDNDDDDDQQQHSTICAGYNTNNSLACKNGVPSSRDVAQQVRQKESEASLPNLSTTTTTPPGPKEIRVTVYNDFACAWCHVGQRRLAKAIQLHYDRQQGHHPSNNDCCDTSSTTTTSTRIHVDWRPYRVDPTVAMEGELVTEYFERVCGGNNIWIDRLRQTGEPDGIEYKNWKWFPNTLKAHQLMVYLAASNQHKDDATTPLVAALLDAVHEQGENISLVDTLVRIAVGCFSNLNENDLRLFLNSDQGADAVQQQIDDGQAKYQIEAVPFYILSSMHKTTANDDDNDQQQEQPCQHTFEPIELAGVQDVDLLCDLLDDLS